MNSKEELDKIKAICELIDGFETTDGFKFFLKELGEEIQQKYALLLAGTKDQFEEQKGYLRGLNYVTRWIRSYRDKYKSLTKVE